MGTTVKRKAYKDITHFTARSRRVAYVDKSGQLVKLMSRTDNKNVRNSWMHQNHYKSVRNTAELRNRNTLTKIFM